MFARGLAVGILAGASACAASIGGYQLLHKPTTTGVHIEYQEPRGNKNGK